MRTMDADVVTQLAFGPLGWAVAAVWGAVWGSFFNVCIHRIGLYESVMRPRSRCPSCGRTVAAFDNLPIVSWLVLRGRCRWCSARISVRYPLVEAIGLALAVATWARFVAAGDRALGGRVGRGFLCFFFCGRV